MTARNGRRSAAALAIAAVLAGAAGCGVPGNGSTRAIAPDDVPKRLLQPRANMPLPSPSPVGPIVTVPRVFFLNADDQLVATPLPVEPAGVTPVEGAVLAALAAGPTEEQRARGLASALGPEVGLRLVEVLDGTARVEVAPSSRSPAADRLPLAVGQVVLSVTSVDGVDRVLLTHGGRPVEAPLPGGAQTSSPLVAADYASLVAAIPGRPQRAEPGPRK